MNRQQLTRQLRALATAHPGMHPYTLALLWEQISGDQLSGRQVRQLLQESQPGSLVTGCKHSRASDR